MRLLALLLLFTLTACTENEEVAENLAAEEITTAEVPSMPNAAQQLVGTWRSTDDRVVTFSADGTMISPLLGDGQIAFRLAVDSLYVSDSDVYGAEGITMDRRYAIESLTDDALTLGPAGLSLAGTYSRAD